MTTNEITIISSEGGVDSRTSSAGVSTKKQPTKSKTSNNKGVKPSTSKKNEKTPDMARTFRVNLNLNTQNNKDNNNNNNYCFNWLDLVAAEEKLRVKAKMGEIVRKKNESTGQSPSEIEAQIEELTKKFEAKYGSPTESIKKKKKARKVDDHADLGFGYDSEDSFIDDSELQDELVPETVTTAHGGFYINTGKLEFKARNSANEDSDVEAVIKAGEKEAYAVKKKRIKTKALGDDEDSSDDPEDRHRGTINPRFS